MDWVDRSNAILCYVKFSKVPINSILDLQICYYDITAQSVLAVSNKQVTVKKSLNISVPNAPITGGSCSGYIGTANPHK